MKENIAPRAAGRLVNQCKQPLMPVLQPAKTDLVGMPLRPREYVHLRDKPDFHEPLKNRGKGEGLCRKMHDLPFEAKVDESLKVKPGKKIALAQHNIPLKNLQSNQEPVPYRRQKKYVEPSNEGSNRKEKGKRVFPEAPAIQRSYSEARYCSTRSEVPRETIEYNRLQLDKQKIFEKEVEREAGYRRKTPERRNEHLMNQIISYGFADFPSQNLTEKVNRTSFKERRHDSFSHRRCKSYYGKKFTDVTRQNIIW
jgi:hypothetical protein